MDTMHDELLPITQHFDRLLRIAIGRLETDFDFLEWSFSAERNGALRRLAGAHEDATAFLSDTLAYQCLGGFRCLLIEHVDVEHRQRAAQTARVERVWPDFVPQRDLGGIGLRLV